MGSSHSAFAFAAALALSPLIFGGSLAFAADPQVTGDKAKAKEWADTAASRFEATDYAGALAAMDEAEKHFRAPTFLELRAQALEKLGRLVEARAVYEKLAAWELPTDCPPVWLEVKKAAPERIRALDRRIAKLTIVVEAEGYSVTLDQKSLSAAELASPIAVDPGVRVVVARSPSGAELLREVQLRIGATERVTIKAYPSDPVPSGIGKTPGFVALGLGSAGLVIGGIFGGLAVAKKGEVLSGIEGCGGACSAGEKARLDGVLGEARTFAGVSTGGFVLAGVGAAAATTLLVIGGRRGKEEGAPVVRITLGSVSISGRF